MNIFVDPALISEVLLQDGWHVVVPGTLNMGKYALVEPNMPAPAAAGFTFHEAGGASVAGPVASILAVRHTQAARTTEVHEAPAVRPPVARPPVARPPATSPAPPRPPATSPAPSPARPPAASQASARPPASKPQPAPDPEPPESNRDWWEP